LFEIERCSRLDFAGVEIQLKHGSAGESKEDDLLQEDKKYLIGPFRRQETRGRRLLRRLLAN
jgi:hypothetical protein